MAPHRRHAMLVAATLALSPLVATLGACSDNVASPPEPVATRPVKSAPEPPREVPTVFDEDRAPEVASESGPAPAIAPRDATPEAQRAAALLALRGDTDPTAVEVEATEGGAPLDPTLRDRLEPGIVAVRRRNPTVRMGATRVVGKLPPEVVQRIVRQNVGRLRRCYEGALVDNPRIEGRIVVRFTIGADGSVKTAKDHESTIREAGMAGCVVKAFAAMSFPPPEAGEVRVDYPVAFAPPDAE